MEIYRQTMNPSLKFENTVNNPAHVEAKHEYLFILTAIGNKKECIF